MAGKKRKAASESLEQDVGDTIVVQPPSKSPYSWLPGGSPKSPKNRRSSSSPPPTSSPSPHSLEKPAVQQSSPATVKASTPTPTPRIPVAPKPSPASPFDLSDLSYIKAQSPAVQNRLLKERLELIRQAKEQQHRDEAEKEADGLITSKDRLDTRSTTDILVANKKAFETNGNITEKTPTANDQNMTPSHPIKANTAQAQAAANLRDTATPPPKPKEKKTRKMSTQTSSPSVGNGQSTGKPKTKVSNNEPSVQDSPDPLHSSPTPAPPSKSKALTSHDQDDEGTIPVAENSAGSNGTLQVVIPRPNTTKKPPLDPSTPSTAQPSTPSNKNAAPATVNGETSSFTPAQDVLLRRVHAEVTAEFWDQVALRMGSRIGEGAKRTAEECRRQYEGEGGEDVEGLLRMFQKPSPKG